MDLLYCFKLEDASGEFEPGTEFLDALELDYGSYFERESGKVWHTVYSTEANRAEELHRQITALLPTWKEYGVDFAIGDIFELHKNEWADAWKKYFTPIEISETLLISPAWQDPVPRPGQALLRIDTGMSFGTGQHPTTFYCLKKIDEAAGSAVSLLDAGCGSGILAAAGALRGFERIDAFDFDAEAVRMTEENLRLNQLEGKVNVSVANAAEYPGDPEHYDLVCANILGHLLITFRFNIAKWVKPSGKLVLAGILSGDFDRVSESFVELGFEEIERETIKEWTGGTFVKH